MTGYGDNFIVVIPVEEGDILHTAQHPFCYNEKCLCHEDAEQIASVNEYYQQGLVTSEEATRIVKGQSLG